MNIQLISKDGQTFEIDSDVARQSTLLKTYSDEGFTGSVPLPNVNGSILRAVVDFCNHHKSDLLSDSLDDDDDPNRDIYEPERSDDISEWDQNFISEFTVADGTLFDIIMAANYLGIPSLTAVGCKTIANMVKGKSSSEMREILNITYNPSNSIANDDSDVLID